MAPVEYVPLREWPRSPRDIPKKPETGWRDGGFGPSMETERKRLRNLESLETTHVRERRRSADLSNKQILRSTLKATEDVKHSRRLIDDADRHQSALSTNIKQSMQHICAHDDARAALREQCDAERSKLNQSGWRNWMDARKQLCIDDDKGERQRNFIRMQASVKQRELASARKAVAKDIVQECRSRRLTAPGSPHLPRSPFQRLGPCISASTPR